MQESHLPPVPFGDGESMLPAPGRFARMARAVAARFGREPAEPPAPFRDSDFESEPSFFGRPLGEH